MSEAVQEVKIVKCANVRCVNECPDYQKYCCRQCSPYGHMCGNGSGATRYMRGRGIGHELPSGEISATRLASIFGVSGGYISTLFSIKAIPGRRENGGTYFMLEEVKSALIASGRSFELDGSLVAIKKKRAVLKRFNFSANARIQGAS